MKHAISGVVFGVMGGFLAFGVHAATAPIYSKNNVLVGVNFQDARGSSDMTLIMKLFSGNKIYVDEGSQVKYVFDADKEKAGWTKVEFDDSKWMDGISGVGFSDGDDNTEVAAGLLSIWTRYHFDISDAASIKELTLLADYDDQYVAFLNGVLIGGSGGGLVFAPGGAEPKWDASTGGAPPNHESSDLAKGKPNAARWAAGAIEKTVVDFKYGGVNSLAVDPKSKAAMTWGELKRP